MRWFIGIDIGSKTSKGVLINEDDRVFRHLLLSGTNYGISASELRDALLVKADISQNDVACSVTTGHADSVLYGDEYVTDIRCCTRGAHHSFPQVRTIIDIQGQSSQVILADDEGSVEAFVVSEKCAGGSGRFLDIVANVLRIKIEDIGHLSLLSQNPVAFTTGCAVFGESEAISRVAEGTKKEDILSGVHKAIAEKIGSLVNRIGLKEPCAVVGGGALNAGLIKSLGNNLGIRLLVPDEPQFITALGAAILAREKDHTIIPGASY
jgi:(R)-2-hydroxyacyl-CoA dehydratese activating ATPase